MTIELVNFFPSFPTRQGIYTNVSPGHARRIGGLPEDDKTKIGVMILTGLRALAL